MQNIFFALIIVFIFSRCAYNNEENLYSSNECDTIQVTYTGSVKGIIQLNCIPCHSTVGNTGNIKLETYSDLRFYALNGRLLGSISMSPGYKPMPQGAPRLSDCDINKVRKWIDLGAKNN